MALNLTIKQAAETFGVTPLTIHRWLKTGLPHTTAPKTGKSGRPRVLIDHAQASVWITANTTKGAYRIGSKTPDLNKLLIDSMKLPEIDLEQFINLPEVEGWNLFIRGENLSGLRGIAQALRNGSDPELPTILAQNDYRKDLETIRQFAAALPPSSI